MSNLTIGIHNLNKYIPMHLELDQPVLLLGAPGQGKSQLIKERAENMDYVFIDIRLSTMDEADLTGYPNPNLKTGRMEFLPASVFPLATDKLPKGKKGFLILLDEITGVNNSMQTAALKLIQDKFIGEHPLHPNTFIMAAGNLGTDGAVVTPLQSTIYDRFAVYYVHQSAEKWQQWAATARTIHPLVLAFLEAHPEMLHTFDANAADPRFSSPRAFEAVSEMLIQQDKVTDLDPADVHAMITSLIGKTAETFIHWLTTASKVVSAKQIKSYIDNKDYSSFRSQLPEMHENDKYIIVVNNTLYTIKNNKFKDKQLNGLVLFIIKEFPDNASMVFIRQLVLQNSAYLDLAAVNDWSSKMSAKQLEI